MPDIYRTLPQSLDAEKGVLCSCLLSPRNVLDECVGLPPEAFYHPAHQLIFEEMLAMHAALVPVDFITLTERLKTKGLPADATPKQKKEHAGMLDKAGGAAAISELFTFVPTASNADYYIDIIREKYRLRQLIHTCTEFAGRAYTEQGEVKILLDEFEQAAMTLGVERADAAAASKPVKHFVLQALDNLDALYKSKGGTIGLPTGIVALDRMTGGFKPATVTVVAARPSMGKTVLGVQFAVLNALTFDPAGIPLTPVEIFSLEMGGAELAERMLGTESNVNIQRWRDGLLSQVDVPKVTRAAARISKSGLHIDETPSLTIMELRARARRAVSKRGVKMIVIDYLQLMRAPSKRADFSRQAEVSDISAGLKAMAKELNIPVVVLAQLNRDADGGRPKLSNLRESGSIEQDADMVILVHRPHKDREKTPEEKEEFKKNGEPAELILAKQRNGPVGEIPVRFRGEFTRFESMNPNEKLYSPNPARQQGATPEPGIFDDEDDGDDDAAGAPALV